MNIDRRLRACADQQGGYFTASQAASAGYPNNLRSYHCKAGNWLKAGRNLYRLPGYRDSEESEFVRWTLIVQGQGHSRKAIISKASALAYYGLSSVRPALVHLTVLSSRLFSPPPGCVCHQESLTEDGYEERQGFRITTVSQTLREMQPDLVYERRWEATVDLAEQKGLLLATEAAALRVRVRSEVLLRPGFAPFVQAGEGGIVTGVLQEKGGEARRSSVRQFGGWAVSGRSFTLIEMLVVIAMISILAALLMPSLSGALHTARGAASSNNLKQQYLAICNYASDSNGYIPPIFGNGLTSLPFTRHLTLLGYCQRNLFSCPEMPQILTDDDWSYGFHAQYGVNWFLPNKGGELTSRKLSTVNHPSKKFYLMDTYANNSDGSSNLSLGYFRVYTYSANVNNPNYGRPAGRHSNRVGMVWADGHYSGIEIPDIMNPFLFAPFNNWNYYPPDL